MFPSAPSEGEVSTASSSTTSSFSSSSSGSSSVDPVSLQLRLQKYLIRSHPSSHSSSHVHSYVSANPSGNRSSNGLRQEVTSTTASIINIKTTQDGRAYDSNHHVQCTSLTASLTPEERTVLATSYRRSGRYALKLAAALFLMLQKEEGNDVYSSSKTLARGMDFLWGREAFGNFYLRRRRQPCKDTNTLDGDVKEDVPLYENTCLAAEGAWKFKLGRMNSSELSMEEMTEITSEWWEEEEGEETSNDDSESGNDASQSADASSYRHTSAVQHQSMYRGGFEACWLDLQGHFNEGVQRHLDELRASGVHVSKMVRKPTVHQHQQQPGTPATAINIPQNAPQQCFEELQTASLSGGSPLEERVTLDAAQVSTSSIDTQASPVLLPKISSTPEELAVIFNCCLKILLSKQKEAVPQRPELCGTELISRDVDVDAPPCVHSSTAAMGVAWMTAMQLFTNAREAFRGLLKEVTPVAAVAGTPSSLQPSQSLLRWLVDAPSSEEAAGVLARVLVRLDLLGKVQHFVLSTTVDAQLPSCKASRPCTLLLLRASCGHIDVVTGVAVKRSHPHMLLRELVPSQLPVGSSSVDMHAYYEVVEDIERWSGEMRERGGRFFSASQPFLRLISACVVKRFAGDSATRTAPPCVEDEKGGSEAAAGERETKGQLKCATTEQLPNITRAAVAKEALGGMATHTATESLCTHILCQLPEELWRQGALVASGLGSASCALLPVSKKFLTSHRKSSVGIAFSTVATLSSSSGVEPEVRSVDSLTSSVKPHVVLIDVHDINTQCIVPAAKNALREGRILDPYMLYDLLPIYSSEGNDALISMLRPTSTKVATSSQKSVSFIFRYESILHPSLQTSASAPTAAGAVAAVSFPSVATANTATTSIIAQKTKFPFFLSGPSSSHERDGIDPEDTGECRSRPHSCHHSTSSSSDDTEKDVSAIVHQRQKQFTASSHVSAATRASLVPPLVDALTEAERCLHIAARTAVAQLKLRGARWLGTDSSASSLSVSPSSALLSDSGRIESLQSLLGFSRLQAERQVFWEALSFWVEDTEAACRAPHFSLILPAEIMPSHNVVSFPSTSLHGAVVQRSSSTRSSARDGSTGTSQSEVQHLLQKHLLLASERRKMITALRRKLADGEFGPLYVESVVLPPSNRTVPREMTSPSKMMGTAIERQSDVRSSNDGVSSTENGGDGGAEIELVLDGFTEVFPDRYSSHQRQRQTSSQKRHAKRAGPARVKSTQAVAPPPMLVMEGDGLYYSPVRPLLLFRDAGLRTQPGFGISETVVDATAAASPTKKPRRYMRIVKRILTSTTTTVTSFAPPTTHSADPQYMAEELSVWSPRLLCQRVTLGSLRVEEWVLQTAWSAESIVDWLFLPPLARCIELYTAADRATCCGWTRQEQVDRMQQDMREQLLLVFTNSDVSDCLEFVGDALVDYCCAFRELHQYTPHGAGRWRRGSVSRAATNKQLSTWLPMCVERYLLAFRGVSCAKKRADTAEALIGAVAMATWVMPLRRLLQRDGELSTALPQASLMVYCTSVLLNMLDCSYVRNEREAK